MRFSVAPMARLFISHATTDRKFVEQELLGLLGALGFEPWFAEDDIQTSEQWERSILGALESSRWFILVMSPRSAKSEWVKDEISWAIDNRPELIIPILLEDCDPHRFHIRIKRIQSLDFRKNTKEAREKLIKLLIEKEYKPVLRESDTSYSHLNKSRKFWTPFIEGGLQIVLGRFREFDAFEQSGVLGVGDAIAMTELKSHIESIGFSGIPISFADRLDGDSLKTNLVLLGGPDANRLTREAAKRINSTLTFGNPDRYEIALYDGTNGRAFVPRRNIKGAVENDFGIILLCKNPFALQKRVLLCAGSFGYGTWACVRFILSEVFLDNPGVVKGAGVEFLIETDILWEAPQHIKAHIIRELKSKA